MNDSLFDLATTGIQPLVMVVSASALALVALVMLASGSRRLERVQHGHVASAQTSPMCAHRQAILVGVLAIFLLTTSACSIETTVNKVVTQTIATLDATRAQLDQESVNWQNTLMQTIDKMTDSIQKTVKDDLSSTLNRAIQATSIEARCDADFLQTRILEDVTRIEVAFEKTFNVAPTVTPPPVEPHACLPDPPSHQGAGWADWR